MRQFPNGIVEPWSTDSGTSIFGFGCPRGRRILGLGSEPIRFSAGVDSFQALQLAMPMIGVTLKCRAKEVGVELFWLGTEPECFERSEWIEIAARLCAILKVDHSWLFDAVDYRDLEVGPL